MKQSQFLEAFLWIE